MIEQKQRSCNLDVLRIFAFLTVVSVHFFYNGEFYGVYINSPIMLAPICIRNFSMICVPLFLMLSGYLLKNRTMSKAYYCKLIPTVGIYLLASICCMIFAYFHNGAEFSFRESIRGVLSFKTAAYSWYVEMYIGLFLMFPFFNLAYGKCSDKGKKILVLTALVSTALPSLFNIWRLEPSWWLDPGSSEDYLELIPNQWEAMYPFTFYFVGAYLRDFPPKIKPLHTFFLIIGVCIVGGLFSMYRCYGYGFDGGRWTAYQSTLTTIQTVLVFHFINSVDLSWVNEKWRKILAKLSSWVLGAYLCSSIFDDWFYPILVEATGSFLRRLVYYPLVVVVVAVCSMALSAILNGIYSLCEKLVVTRNQKKQQIPQ